MEKEKIGEYLLLILYKILYIKPTTTLIKFYKKLTNSLK